jgi:hypothetical protein
LATWEDFYNWQAATFTPVSSNVFINPDTQRLTFGVTVLAPAGFDTGTPIFDAGSPVFDAANPALPPNPNGGYIEPGIQDASFEFVTTVVPLIRAGVGIVAAAGRGIGFGISSSTSSLAGRLLADETGAIGKNLSLEITFGHGARHLIGIGLTSDVVEAAIRADIISAAGGASATGSFWGTVAVEGQTIIYRAFTVADNLINVGTYYVKP